MLSTNHITCGSCHLSCSMQGGCPIIFIAVCRNHCWCQWSSQLLSDYVSLCLRNHWRSVFLLLCFFVIWAEKNNAGKQISTMSKYLENLIIMVWPGFSPRLRSHSEMKRKSQDHAQKQRCRQVSTKFEQGDNKGWAGQEMFQVKDDNIQIEYMMAKRVHIKGKSSRQ